jgi:hypothetical protein
MPVDPVLEEFSLHGLDEMQLDLDLLAAGDDDRVGDQRHAVAVPRRIGANLLRQARPDGEQPFVDEDDAAMLPVRLQAAQRIDQNGVVPREESGREHDGKFVGDGEFLQMRCRLRRRGCAARSGLT